MKRFFLATLCGAWLQGCQSQNKLAPKQGEPVVPAVAPPPVSRLDVTVLFWGGADRHPVLDIRCDPGLGTTYTEVTWEVRGHPELTGGRQTLSCQLRSGHLAGDQPRQVVVKARGCVHDPDRGLIRCAKERRIAVTLPAAGKNHLSSLWAQREQTDQQLRSAATNLYQIIQNNPNVLREQLFTFERHPATPHGERDPKLAQLIEQVGTMPEATWRDVVATYYPVAVLQQPAGTIPAAATARDAAADEDVAAPPGAGLTPYQAFTTTMFIGILGSRVFRAWDGRSGRIGSIESDIKIIKNQLEIRKLIRENIKVKVPDNLPEEDELAGNLASKTKELMVLQQTAHPWGKTFKTLAIAGTIGLAGWAVYALLNDGDRKLSDQVLDAAKEFGSLNLAPSERSPALNQWLAQLAAIQRLAHEARNLDSQLGGSL